MFHDRSDIWVESKRQERGKELSRWPQYRPCVQANQYEQFRSGKSLLVQDMAVNHGRPKVIRLISLCLKKDPSKDLERSRVRFLPIRSTDFESLLCVKHFPNLYEHSNKRKRCRKKKNLCLHFHRGKQTKNKISK